MIKHKNILYNTNSLNSLHEHSRFYSKSKPRTNAYNPLDQPFRKVLTNKIGGKLEVMHKTYFALPGVKYTVITLDDITSKYFYILLIYFTTSKLIINIVIADGSFSENLNTNIYIFKLDPLHINISIKF